MAKTLTLEEMKANRRKWVEALRSGKYEQGKDALRSGDKFCCLGVLADIAGCSWKLYDEESGDSLYVADNGSGDFAPKRAMNFVGLLGDNGSMTGRDALARENDLGASFSEIADIIESEPEGLFVAPQVEAI